MADLDVLHDAIINYSPDKKKIVDDYERILNDIDKDDYKEIYITLFLQAIIPKVIDKNDWALPIFELILKKAYVNRVYLNTIDIKLEPVVEPPKPEAEPVVEPPKNLSGDIIFLYFKIQEAIDLIKTYPSIFYNSEYEFNSKSSTLILKLNAMLEFNVDVSKNVMFQIIYIFLENPELQPLLKKCIEHFTPLHI